MPEDHLADKEDYLVVWVTRSPEITEHLNIASIYQRISILPCQCNAKIIVASEISIHICAIYLKDGYLPRIYHHHSVSWALETLPHREAFPAKVRFCPKIATYLIRSLACCLHVIRVEEDHPPRWPPGHTGVHLVRR
jgi:hypothetical protein